MQDYAAEENYFSEEGLEAGTESLMQKLEAAKDPDTYREQFHRRTPSSGQISGPDGETHNTRRRVGPLLITALAILAGALAGILLNMYVF